MTSKRIIEWLIALSVGVYLHDLVAEVEYANTAKLRSINTDIIVELGAVAQEMQTNTNLLMGYHDPPEVGDPESLIDSKPDATLLDDAREIHQSVKNLKAGLTVQQDRLQIMRANQ